MGGGPPGVSLPPRYRFERDLGGGGFGRVVLATDTALGREVAVKLLHRHMQGPEARARFVAEARTTAARRDPSVVRVLDHGFGPDETPFIVYELLEPGTLADRIAAGGVSLPVALDWGARIADALAAVHRAGILHRDVKPANVMFRRDGTPVLTDFGLARDDADLARLTATGQVLGTPLYLAPELWVGALASPASDQYAWALSLLPLCYGLTGLDAPAAAWLDPAGRPADRDGIPPGLKGRLPRIEPVLARALAREPGRRFPDMADFAAALRAAGEPGGEATVARPAPPPAPRSPAPAGAGPRTGLAVLGILLVGIVGSWMRPGPGTGDAGRPPAAAAPGPEAPPESLGRLESARLDLERLMVAQAKRWDDPRLAAKALRLVESFLAALVDRAQEPEFDRAYETLRKLLRSLDLAEGSTDRRLAVMATGLGAPDAEAADRSRRIRAVARELEQGVRAFVLGPLTTHPARDRLWAAILEAKLRAHAPIAGDHGFLERAEGVLAGTRDPGAGILADAYAQILLARNEILTPDAVRARLDRLHAWLDGHRDVPVPGAGLKVRVDLVRVLLRMLPTSSPDPADLARIDRLLAPLEAEPDRARRQLAHRSLELALRFREDRMEPAPVEVLPLVARLEALFAGLAP